MGAAADQIAPVLKDGDLVILEQRRLLVQR